MNERHVEKSGLDVGGVQIGPHQYLGPIFVYCFSRRNYLYKGYFRRDQQLMPIMNTHVLDCFIVKML